MTLMQRIQCLDELYISERANILAVLPAYIGTGYSALLCALCHVEYMDQLGDCYETQISGIPGFGPVKMAKIKEAMSLYDVSFLPSRAEERIAEGLGKFAAELGQSPDGSHRERARAQNRAPGPPRKQ